MSAGKIFVVGFWGNGDICCVIVQLSGLKMYLSGENISGAFREASVWSIFPSESLANAERQSAERAHAERLALAGDPLLRLQMAGHPGSGGVAGPLPSTHTHAHSHTHLHLHQAETAAAALLQAQAGIPPAPPPGHGHPPPLPGKRHIASLTTNHCVTTCHYRCPAGP